MSFEILPGRGLVLVTCSGEVGLEETRVAAAACAGRPEFDPGFRNLFDLSRVTGYERDLVRFFALQAELAAIYVEPGVEQFVVFYAPTRPGQEMAGLVRKSWEGVGSQVFLIAETEGQALRLLGRPEETIEALFADVG